jgi:plastocyanin
MSRRTVTTALACLFLLGGALLAGCGGGSKKSSSSTSSQNPPASTSSASGSGGASSGTVKVSMKNIAFNPNNVTVKVGQKVEWTNDDSVGHNVVAQSGASFQSKVFNQGGTYSFTPKKAGTIQYVCTIHPGMNGTLTVTG